MIHTRFGSFSLVSSLLSTPFSKSSGGGSLRIPSELCESFVAVVSSAISGRGIWVSLKAQNCQIFLAQSVSTIQSGYVRDLPVACRERYLYGFGRCYYAGQPPVTARNRQSKYLDLCYRATQLLLGGLSILHCMSRAFQLLIYINLYHFTVIILYIKQHVVSGSMERWWLWLSRKGETCLLRLFTEHVKVNKNEVCSETKWTCINPVQVTCTRETNLSSIDLEIVPVYLSLRT